MWNESLTQKIWKSTNCYQHKKYLKSCQIRECYICYNYKEFNGEMLHKDWLVSRKEKVTIEMRINLKI